MKPDSKYVIISWAAEGEKEVSGAGRSRRGFPSLGADWGSRDLRKCCPAVTACQGEMPGHGSTKPGFRGSAHLTPSFPCRSLKSLMGTGHRHPPRLAAVISPCSCWNLATSLALPRCPWHLPSLVARPAMRSPGGQWRSWHPSPMTKVS